MANVIASFKRSDNCCLSNTSVPILFPSGTLPTVIVPVETVLPTPPIVVSGL